MSGVDHLLTLFVLFIAMPLNWFVTVLLWHLAHQVSRTPHFLRERAIFATSISVIVTVFAVIFFNNDLVPPALDFESTKLFTRGILFLMSTLPVLYWLRIYFKL